MVIIGCDVLVVGAGPAGSVAALYCSKQGLNTALIEKSNKIGAHTNTRIDSSPDFGLTKIIKEMKLKTENLVYKSKWHSPSGSSFTLDSKIGEYYFKRGHDPDSFECSTVSKAIKNGCKLFLDAAVEEINKNGEMFDEVIISQGAERTVIKTEIIIAADGGNSIFHRYFDKRFVKKNRVAYGITGRDFIQPDTSEIYFDAELAPGGYFYLVTCLNGISSAGIVLDSNKMQKNAGDYFFEYLNKNPKIADKINPIITINNFVGCGEMFDLDMYLKKNLLFVGDAAGLIGPFLGYGMMPAIISAYCAGKHSVNAVNDKDYSLLNGYDAEIKQRFTKRLPHLYRKVFNSFNNEDFDLLIEMLKRLQSKIDIDELLSQLDSLECEP
jgi:digeranylgeranylglycerophospholipid reductase